MVPSLSRYLSRFLYLSPLTTVWSRLDMTATTTTLDDIPLHSSFRLQFCLITESILNASLLSLPLNRAYVVSHLGTHVNKLCFRLQSHNSSGSQLCHVNLNEMTSTAIYLAHGSSLLHSLQWSFYLVFKQMILTSDPFRHHAGLHVIAFSCRCKS